jgi:protein involved in polysaccharide export with SLBB domain
MNKLKLLLLSFFVVGSLAAQDLSKLSPEQQEMYKKYMASKTGQSTNNAVSTPKETVDEVRVVEESDGEAKKLTKKNINNDNVLIKVDDSLPIFGTYLFNTQNLTFEPKLNIATPHNYVLGTYDELNINISGLYEANYKLKVSPEGVIRIPNVGPIKVANLTIENATKAIRNQIAKVYMGTSSGETRVNVSLGDIRSIRVTVVGEAVRPGSYTLPSLATAFNALYSCGGPNNIGSMRDIKVIRAGKVIAKLDIYRFLVEGILSDNVVLQDEDVIKIDPYKVRVYLNGAVKHKAIFEGVQGENLQSIIRYAGGFTDDAYTEKITAYRHAGKEKTIVDISYNQLSKYIIGAGDSIVVSRTLNRFNNKIDILGSVMHPGTYAFEPGLTMKKLIEKADGLKEDAFINMAFINRRNEKRIPEVVGFNLGDLMEGKIQDILLQKDDSIEIPSLFDYREKQTISIWGAVKEPGTYPYVDKITLKDLIFKAKGFTELASTDSVELVRVVKDQETLLNTNKKTTVRKFALDKDLNFVDGLGDEPLQNRDQVIVRSISGYEGIRMVRVEGEVLHPGSYNIRTKSERVSDVVKRSGGFTRYAYAAGAFLIRTESTNPIEQKLNKIMQENSKNQLENQQGKTLDATMLRQSGATSVQGYTAMDSIQKKLSGTKVIDKIFAQEGVVGLNLKEIVSNPGGKYDLKLEEGDIIYIPRELQTVRVVGQVLFPTIVRYDKSMRLTDYISGSGGFSLNANKNKVFVLYPNGSAKSTKSFLGIKTYPRVQPGSRIVVPENPVEIKNKLTPAETVAILTSISSVVALMYSILKQ